jgi:hypothetical protein
MAATSPTPAFPARLHRGAVGMQSINAFANRIKERKIMSSALIDQR